MQGNNSKIVFLTEAGKNIGFGHIVRCASVCQAFEKLGIKSQLIVNGDESVRDFLRGMNFVIFDWLNDQKTLTDIIKSSDIVFVDSYLADYELYKKVSNTVRTAVYFDDNLRIEYPRGIVLNGAISVDQMPYPKRKGISYLLGVQYAPLRKEFWNVPVSRIHSSLEVVMITFGGADTRNLTPKILRLLNDVYPKLLKKVVIGMGFRHTAEIERFKNKYTELIYYPDASVMKNVMLESDIAISACGQTLYELARMGVSTIGLCVAQNQLRGIEGWEKTGFLEFVGWYNHKNLEQKLENSLRRLANKEVRIRRSEIGKDVVDGNGCFRIADYILNNL